jgi:hypothetical protein
MPHLSSLLQGLARSLSVGRDRKADGGAGDGTAAAALRSSGTMWGAGSETFAAVCSRRGEKGSNQDCSVVLEVSPCHAHTPLSLSLGLIILAGLITYFSFLFLLLQISVA